VPADAVIHNLSQRTALVLGASCLSLVTLVALLRTGSSPADSQPNSDLLAVLQGRSSNLGPPRVSPDPPVASRWHSPMASACSRPDPRLSRRLAVLLRALPSRIRTIPTDPSNFAPRQSRDAFGNPLDPKPRVVVLHETVYGIDSAISTFTTHHSRDDDQVSYHTLIGLDGQVVQVLDPRWRAFGAGHSAFEGEWAITNSQVGGSINNFALHLSLETPLDGEGDGPGHSGYTQAQYDAAAIVLAGWMHQFGIPWQRITTHRHVDLGGERADPRSFDWQALQNRLVALGMIDCHHLSG
jgi:N-acetyl-anhydromuramyl-L-alanine amidase AmpD